MTLLQESELAEVVAEISAAANRASPGPYAPYGAHAIVHRDTLIRWAELIREALDG